MPVQKVTIEQFLDLAKTYPVLDVRSPGEFLHAHIPGANNLPLFTDEERKVVGTAYKQQSREIAIKIGLDYFGVKMRRMVEEAEQLCKTIGEKTKSKETDHESTKTKNTLLVHCWRGGMRSAGVAWLLDLYGFKVYTLNGGYKMYRKWAREQFIKSYSLNVVGGYTGSGKTLVLKELKRIGKAVIDLEGLANHKGSAFGALGEESQPTQEMFENLLAKELNAVNDQYPGTVLSNNAAVSSLNNFIYIEDESQRIGLLNIPAGLWDQMRKSPISFFDIPFEERLNYLTEAYGKFEKEKLVNAIIRIQKRLGGLETKNAINHLLENNYKECFRILLMYYDKWYNKSLHNRERLPAMLHKISCNAVDIREMTYTLTNEKATTS
ncbi:MAG: tRNA 2-selenouridine(34) synthase MnmH [Ferruginibacter sp.]